MPLIRRDPPAETIAALRPPVMDPDFAYFPPGDDLRFRATLAPGDDPLVNASWLADACLLVYGEPGFIADRVANIPFELNWIGTEDDNQGMVLSGDDALILVFRGTRLLVKSLLEKVEFTTINQDDLRVDAAFLPRVCDAGGKVHSGFLDAFEAACPALDAILASKRPEQSLWLAGHSLGGALATLAAAHIGAENIEGLFTYGCPRVGDRAFVKTLPERNYERFVHRDDWVTTVPPEQLLGYHHGGHLVEIRAGKRDILADLTEGAQDFLKAVKAMQQDLQLRPDTLPFKIGGLADHAPVYYATILWNTLVEKNG